MKKFSILGLMALLCLFSLNVQALNTPGVSEGNGVLTLSVVGNKGILLGGGVRYQ